MNVCSGVAVTIRELLRAVLGALDLGRAAAIAQEATTAPGRPDDLRWLVGDPGRFTRLTGADPGRIALAQSVADAVGGAA